MNYFVKQLRKDHQRILYLLRQIHQTNLSSPYRKEQIIELEHDINKHIQQEKEHLFPFLKTVSQNQANLKGMLNFLEDSLSSFSNFMQHFLKRFLEPGKSETFPWYFEKLRMTLENRIFHNEKILYKIYEEEINRLKKIHQLMSLFVPVNSAFFFENYQKIK